MRKFFSYEAYEAWRDAGDHCDIPVKLVGEGCFDWQDKYDRRAEITQLRAENEALREAHGEQERYLHEAEKLRAELEQERELVKMYRGKYEGN